MANITNYLIFRHNRFGYPVYPEKQFGLPSPSGPVSFSGVSTVSQGIFLHSITDRPIDQDCCRLKIYSSAEPITYLWFQDKRRSPKRQSGQTQEC